MTDELSCPERIRRILRAMGQPGAPAPMTELARTLATRARPCCAMTIWRWRSGRTTNPGFYYEARLHELEVQLGLASDKPSYTEDIV